MKNKALVIILTCLVFFVVCAIGLKELFSVRDITVEYSVFDQKNVEDVTEILEKYRGKNLLFLDAKKIEEEITADKFFKVTEVKKIYPCEVFVSLSERKASFYYEHENAGEREFILFDNEFFVIGKVNDKPILSSGITQVGFVDKLNGFQPSFDLKKQIDFAYGFNTILAECVRLSGDFMQNITSINFVAMPEEGNYRVVIKTVEGVFIEIRNADKDLSTKVEKGILFYESLSESERIENAILVYNESADIRCDYTKNAERLV